MSSLDSEVHQYAQEAPDPRSLFQRIRDRFFPGMYCSTPETEQPGADCIRLCCITKFRFFERIKVLLTGHVVTEAKIVTGNPTLWVAANAVCYPITKSQIKERTNG